MTPATLDLHPAGPAPAGRREDLRRVTLSTLGMEDIFEAEGLGPLGEEAVEQEMAEAAQQFTAAGEEYDEGRLREQVAEVLKVGGLHARSGGGIKVRGLGSFS